MGGRIFLRDGLWPGEQRDLERRPFNALNASQDERLETAYKLMLQTKALDDPPAAQVIDGLAYTHIKAILDIDLEADISLRQDKFPPLPLATVDLYMEALCNYVNKIRCTDDPVALKPSETEPSYASRPQHIRTNTRFMSCKAITSTNFERCYPHTTGTQGAIDVLQDINCTGEDFMNLDYLFIALHAPYIGDGHFSLLGIAPKQHFVFAIDSLYYQSYSVQLAPLDGVMNIFRSQIGVEEAATWPVYTQWSMRPKDTTDKSPTAAEQSDSYNCAIFTIMNAFCLAFGFDLLSYCQADLDSLKRPRMFLELVTAVDKCFAGDCAYDMLDIPDGPLYRSPTPDFIPSNRFDSDSEEEVSDEVMMDDKLEDDSENLQTMGKGKGRADSDSDMEEERDCPSISTL